MSPRSKYWVGRSFGLTQPEPRFLPNTCPSRLSNRSSLVRLPRGTGLAHCGLSERRFGLTDRRNSNQVHFVVNVGGWRQITHRSLQRLVAHPVLHGPYIEPPAQHSRGIGGAKCLQIEL